MFSAVYLSYCDGFVTNDQQQERCFSKVVAATTAG
jgi:hypothetical protein